MPHDNVYLSTVLPGYNSGISKMEFWCVLGSLNAALYIRYNYV